MINTCVTSSVAFYKKDKYENDLLIVKHVTGININPDKKDICYHVIVKDKDGKEIEKESFTAFETAKAFGLNVLTILDNERSGLCK